MLKVMSLVLLTVAVSCGGKKSSSSNKVVQQIFVKGDPLTMIADTSKDTNSFINTTNTESFNSFHLAGANIFAEKELITKEETRNIEEGQEAETEDQTQRERSTYSFSTENGDWVYTDQSQQIKLIFEQFGESLNLKRIKIATTNYEAEMQHYSVSPDQTKMSFLMKLKTEQEGSVLLALVFAKAGTQKSASKTSEEFFYLMGPGVKVPFKTPNETIDVVVCQNASDRLGSYLIESGIRAWEAPLKKARPNLSLNINTTSTCKPFSDVNQHSIQYIDGYLTKAEEHIMNPAFAMVRTDLNDLVHFDSDIIILGSELNKSSLSNSYLEAIVAHEFGHFLGLDHQFNDVPSIMSYEDYRSLQDYDRRAIFSLYAADGVAYPGEYSQTEEPDYPDWTWWQ